MSNRSKRTLVVANAEPAFVQSCVAKWSKGLQRGAKWDKVRAPAFQAALNTSYLDICYAFFFAGSFACACVLPCLVRSSGTLWIESPRTVFIFAKMAECPTVGF